MHTTISIVRALNSSQGSISSIVCPWLKGVGVRSSDGDMKRMPPMLFDSNRLQEDGSECVFSFR